MSDCFSRPVLGAVYRIDVWADSGGGLEREVAMVTDLQVARVTFAAAVEHWPGKSITLRRGAMIIMKVQSEAEERKEAIERELRYR